MISPEWIATILGALLCLTISWFLSAVSHSQGVRLGKVGPAIGIAGALVLAGMAVVGPLHDSKSEGFHIMSNYITEGRLENLKRRSLMVRTIREAGRRPDRDHLPFKHSDGKLVWVTKEEFRKLKKEEKED